MRSPLRALGDLVARTPVPWVGVSGGGGWLSSLFGAVGGDYERQMAAMESSGTLFTIVNGIAADVAAVEWHMHRTRGVRPGSVCERCAERGVVVRGVEQVEDHQALRVWDNPNDFTTGQEYREALQQHVDLTGEGWMVAEMSAVGDFPTALWSPRPDRMRPVPDKETFLSGYIYRGPGGEDIPLDVGEVVQVRMPNPLDPYRGLGPVQAALVDLDATRYTAEWNRQFFVNSAEPGGVLEVPEELSDTAFNRLRSQWSGNHRGIRNAHRVAILENGTKWVDRSFSQKDMQFVELYQMGKQSIREAFRYPEWMLGSMENANKASATVVDAYYARRLLVPRLMRLKTSANADFLPMFGATGKGVKLVYDNPVPADKEADNSERDSKVAAYTALVTSGVDPSDAADVVGLPPMRTRSADPVEVTV